MPKDLFILIPYFNPYGYSTRIKNLNLCIDSLKNSTADYAVVEVIFPNRKSELSAGINSIQLKADSIVWQKERIINAAVSGLDPAFSKIAWIDSNVIFSDSSWLKKTSQLLDKVMVGQLFQTVREYRLVKGQGITPKTTISSITNLIKQGTMHDSAWAYAWAARRELLEKVGLYDPLIFGGGSLAWIYALMLNRGSKFLWARAAQEQSLFSNFSPVMNQSYMNWANKLASFVGNEIGVLDSEIQALWHNDLWPLSRRAQLYNHLSPADHLRLNSDGCWEWTDSTNHLANSAREIFMRREEDG